MDFSSFMERTIELGRIERSQMAKIGYARISSANQNLDRQLKKLKGTKRIFQEAMSGAEKNRPQLKAMLDYIREGDIVVVTELERLGRNNGHLTEVMNTIQTKGATLEVLNLPTLQGIEDDNLRRLLFNLIIEIYKYQAEEERTRIRERQQQGIELAKRKGKYKGKPPKYKSNDPRLLHAFDLFKQNYSEREIEKMTGINTRTFRRYRKKYNIQRNIV